MKPDQFFDAVIIGGGPAGATTAHELCRLGRSVLLLDREGRIKPCGGAIPPRLIADFEIPEKLLAARIRSARMISPSQRQVDMPIDGGYVGMVDRGVFDPWLRARAVTAGAQACAGIFDHVTREHKGAIVVHYRPAGFARQAPLQQVRARVMVGADGANSSVAKQCILATGRVKPVPCVSAYHEIVAAPPGDTAGYDGSRCDVYYQGVISPDFYGWVFPHGNTLSIGVGTAQAGFSLRDATTRLRIASGHAQAQTLRREGAPIPLRPLSCWDNGSDVVLAGDAAGVVAPASGEGIYYAMASGRFVAEAVDQFCIRGDARALGLARRRFMAEHGRVFWILGILQRFWYADDRRRERFVSMCRDPDVQRLTWEAYMNKRLVRARPAAHVRIFFKDLAHLFGLVRP